MNKKRITLIPIENMPIVQKGDDISRIIISTLKENRLTIQPGDILAITHKIVSISEGSYYVSSEIIPSQYAKKIAEKVKQSEIRVEAALRESISVLRESPTLITKTRQGFITDFSGIDQSNAPTGTLVALPNDPDKSAEKFHLEISQAVGFNVPVIITDTQGRPWRRGAVNIAIGIAGMSPFTVNKGKLDRHKRLLHSSLICIADEIAAAAELVMGQSNEMIPAVIVRGILFDSHGQTASSILRDESENLFL